MISRIAGRNLIVAETLCVPISGGFASIVDSEHFESIKTCELSSGRIITVAPSSLNWRAVRNHNIVYAEAYCGNGRIKLHRLLMESSRGVSVDHIDRNGLNNKLANLRHCNTAQNLANQVSRGGASRFKGVSRTNRIASPWRATISITRDGIRKCVRIGSFATEEQAARAYDKVAFENFGEFANLNFPALHS